MTDKTELQAAAAVLGRHGGAKGGRARSTAKTLAARKNGRQGGRPILGPPAATYRGVRLYQNKFGRWYAEKRDGHFGAGNPVRARETLEGLIDELLDLPLPIPCAICQGPTGDDLKTFSTMGEDGEVKTWAAHLACLKRLKAERTR